MASLSNISVTPNTIVKGQAAQIKLTIANPDRVSTVTGVDETGARVTATYDVHENLVVNAVPAAQLPTGSAPAGTIVISAPDALTPSNTDITAVTLQTA